MRKIEKALAIVINGASIQDARIVFGLSLDEMEAVELQVANLQEISQHDETRDDVEEMAERHYFYGNE